MHTRAASGGRGRAKAGSLMGNAIRMGESIRGRRLLAGCVEEEEATSISSSDHLCPLSYHLSLTSTTSYPHL